MVTIGKSHEPWTAEELQTLKDMYANGVDPIDIAIRLNRKYNGVLTRIRNLHLSPTGSPKGWSYLEDQMLVTILKQGKPYRIIADEIGRTVTACVGRMARIMARERYVSQKCNIFNNVSRVKQCPPASI